MRRRGFAAVAIVAMLALVAVGCSKKNTASSTGWGTATSAQAGGGMDALVTAAKAEGTLNAIALPSDWANYGNIIKTFQTKYGITVKVANPSGSSQDEVDAVRTRTRACSRRTRSPPGATSLTARRSRPGSGIRTTAATWRSGTTRRSSARSRRSTS